MVDLDKQWEITEIRKMLPHDSKVVLYKTLVHDKRHRRDIFMGLDSLIVLYEGVINNTRQGHYVCLIPRSTHIEYFSSLGYSPQHETTILGIENTHFQRVLGKNYKYSRIKLQRDAYNVNTCGLWCVARAYMHSDSLQAFQRFFNRKQHVRGPDDKLLLMTHLLTRIT